MPQREGPDEEPFSIAFNHKYLLDGLKAMSTEHVKLLCTLPNTPAVFVPFHPPSEAAAAQAPGGDVDGAGDVTQTEVALDDGGSGDFEYLIMPMQLPSNDDSAWAPPGTARPTTLGR